jgi:hypothetical protein
MQPLAVYALATAVVMVIGVSVTLVRTRRAVNPRPGRVNRWQLHGSIPFAAAGLALGVISRGSGQSSTTHNVLSATAVTMLLAALLCALVGAAVATTGQQPPAPQ